MCEERNGKFVVPTRRGAGMGWWIGQIIGRNGNFCTINLLWVEVAEYAGDNTTHSMGDYVLEFEDASSALDHLLQMGVVAQVPAQVA